MIDRPTIRRTNRGIGKLHFQKCNTKRKGMDEEVLDYLQFFLIINEPTYLNSNFPMTLHVCWSISRRSEGWSVRRSFFKGQEVTLLCSHRSTRFFIYVQNIIICFIKTKQRSKNKKLWSGPRPPPPTTHVVVRTNIQN